ncbi:TniB family NTP-binding protein [Thalassotalea euphylliae]|uniref:TniB family NTP-binding protein n=1 Tax=Thalassotalea euphylliae TaxID=1655234 RepID=UPI0036337E20
MAELLPDDSPELLEETHAFLAQKMRTPDIAIVRKAFDACRATRHTNCVQGMYLIGDSGTGKSYIARSYAEQSPPYQTDVQRVVPVLYVNLQEKSTSKALIQRLYRKLTGVKRITGSEEEIQARLVARLRKSQTELIILDEAQHLVRETSSVSAQHAADAIKALMDDEDGAGIPVICVGIDSAAELLTGKAKFKAEKQLQRRNRKLHRIAGYSVGTSNWKSLIEMYQKALDCKVNLCTEDMLKRLHLATHGLFGNLTPLFKEAIEIAGSRDAITKESLAKAYRVFQPKNELSCNPFDTTMATIEMHLTTKLVTNNRDAA